MSKRLIRWTLSFAAGLLLIFSVSSVFAAEKNVLQRQDTVVPAGQTVENVLVVGGNATILGTVRDSVIIVNGDLDIKQSANIKGLVLVLGGTIYQESGAQVTDNVLNITFDQTTLNSLLIGGAMIAGIWFLRLAASLALVIAPVLLFLIVGNNLGSYESILGRSPWRLMTVGFVTSISVLAFSILLSITIFGIPLVIVLMLLVLVSFLLGLTAVSKSLGRWIPGNGERPAWITVFGGAMLLAAATNVPLFGGIALLALFWISLGMVTLWLWEKRKRT